MRTPLSDEDRRSHSLCDGATQWRHDYRPDSCSGKRPKGRAADAINRHRLHIRKDGKPVTSAQVYAVICRFPEMFTKEAGRIMLMI